MYKIIQTGLLLLGILPVWAITWSSPTVIFSTMSADVQLPKLALHPTNQTALVAWVSQVSMDYVVEASFYDGVNWSARNTFSGISVDHLPLVSVGIDNDGNGIAVWDLFDTSALYILAATFASEGGAWSSADPIQNLGASEYNSFPTLAVNDAGYGAAAWRTSTNEFQAKTYNPFANEWSSSYFINNSDLPLSPSYSFPIALDPSNNLISFFISSAGSSTLWYATLNALDPVPTNSPALTVSFTSLSPRFALDPSSGRLIFAIQPSQFSKSPLFSGANYNGQATWNLRLISRPNATASNLSIDINPNNGRAVAAWQLDTGVIQASVFDGVRWSIPHTLSSNGNSPAVAISQQDNSAIAVWADLSGGSTNTIRTAEHHGISWSSSTAISDTTNLIGPPQIAIDENGFGIVTWSREEGAAMQIEAVTSQ